MRVTRPLRVAFVSHHPHVRMGGQRSMALLIEHLNRLVVEPLAICPGPGELTDHLRALDCPVVHIPLHPIKPRTLRQVWASSRRIRALLQERAIDIVAPDAPRDALTCGLAKLGTTTKLVWFVRLTAPDRLDPVLARLADGVIGVSEAARRRFSGSARMAARSRTIADGADLRLFRPPEDRAGLRRALGLPEDRFLLLFVGQITRPKGILDIVDAMGLLQEAPPPGPRPALIIIGTPHPPTILDEIAARARERGAAGDVQVLTQREDVYRWMQCADALVSGSHQDTEGLSRVLFEAMACGTVPIATDIRGNREALAPDTGLLVPEQSPADLARAVRFLIEHPDRRAALSAGGVRRAREKFDIERHARAVETFCVELVASLRQ